MDKILIYLETGEYRDIANFAISTSITILICFFLRFIIKKIYNDKKLEKSLHHRLIKNLLIILIYIGGIIVIVEQIPQLSSGPF